MTSLWLRPPHPSGRDVSLYSAGRFGFGVRLHPGHTAANSVVLRPFAPLVLTVSAVQGGGAQSLSYTGIGGALTDGAATVTIALIAPVAGGAITDGAAPAARALVAPVSGGAVTNGSGVAALALAATPTGGAQTDGAATTARSLSVAPIGGIAAGGAATVSIALAVAPVGAAQTDGSATSARSLTVTPAGGALANGAATATLALAVNGTGEALTAGAADVESTTGGALNLSYTGTGGAVASGAASISETITPPIAASPGGRSTHRTWEPRRRTSKHLVVVAGKGSPGSKPRFGGSAVVETSFVADRRTDVPAPRSDGLSLSHRGAVRFTPRGTASISIAKRQSMPPPALPPIIIAAAISPPRRRARALALALALVD